MCISVKNLPLIQITEPELGANSVSKGHLASAHVGVSASQTDTACRRMSACRHVTACHTGTYEFGISYLNHWRFFYKYKHCLFEHCYTYSTFLKGDMIFSG